MTNTEGVESKQHTMRDAIIMKECVGPYHNPDNNLMPTVENIQGMSFLQVDDLAPDDGPFWMDNLTSVDTHLYKTSHCIL